MDTSFYASLYDTSRELLSNNTSEAPTGLYSILCALYELKDISPSTKQEFAKNKIHLDYPNVIDSIYLIFYTSKQSHLYKSKVKQRTNAFLDIQKFKQDCFREITKVLEIIRPETGIEWRFERKV
jgi:hypothetical protein